MRQCSGATALLLRSVARHRGGKGLSRLLIACRKMPWLTRAATNAFFRPVGGSNSAESAQKRIEAYAEAEHLAGPSAVLNTAPLIASRTFVVHLGDNIKKGAGAPRAPRGATATGDALCGSFGARRLVSTLLSLATSALESDADTQEFVDAASKALRQATQTTASTNHNAPGERSEASMGGAGANIPQTDEEETVSAIGVALAVLSTIADNAFPARGSAQLAQHEKGVIKGWRDEEGILGLDRNLENINFLLG